VGQGEVVVTEVVVGSGQLWKRYTVCKIVNHNWRKIEYPGIGGSGYFLRCLRCGKENHNAGGALNGSPYFAA